MRRRPAVLRLFDRHPASLKGELNTLVDYLSNSPDIYVINLLNQYPFTPTYKNLPGIIATTDSLISRLSPAGDFAKDN